MIIKICMYLAINANGFIKDDTSRIPMVILEEDANVRRYRSSTSS